MDSMRVTTAEIVARRALEMTCGQECVDWATDVLTAGRDTPHLRMLAGAEGPHNHFELAELRDRTLDELGEAPVSHVDGVRIYARERLRAATAGSADLRVEIAVVADLCSTNDYPGELHDFYLLHNAYEDLQSLGVQFYWPDADRANILAIMKHRAEEFVRDESGDGGR
jgi:hypothetical protein